MPVLLNFPNIFQKFLIFNCDIFRQKMEKCILSEFSVIQKVKRKYLLHREMHRLRQTEHSFVKFLRLNEIRLLNYSIQKTTIKFSSIILSLRTTKQRKMGKICQTFSSRSHKTCLTQFVIKLFLFLSVKTPTK